MSRIILTALLFFLGNSLYAQIHISTNLRENFFWSKTKKDWVFESQDDQELTFFEINKDMTLVKHTTPSMTSSYMVKSSKEDKKNDQWEFDLVSDVGNKYLMILDIKNNNVRFIGGKQEELFLVRHRIKRLWFDE